MSLLWSYFWPALAAGLVIGLVTGLIAFRRPRTKMIVAIGLAASLASAALWHGPAGAADAFSARVERSARVIRDDWEMRQVQARLCRGAGGRGQVL